MPPAATLPPGPSDDLLSGRVIPPDAKPLRVNWHLKLGRFKPGARSGSGRETYVIRDEATFRDVLPGHLDGGGVDTCVRWNGIDFRKQMVLIVSWSEDWRGGGGRIDSVWRTTRGIVASIEIDEGAHGGVSLPASWYPCDAVAVNRSDLPVEFVWQP
ncbi:MAG: hypothetical protein HYY93_13815 [Planctomycetes bacterium]|nr:hypothetical protein [Planctomycetota bacterium]